MLVIIIKKEKDPIPLWPDGNLLRYELNHFDRNIMIEEAIHHGLREALKMRCVDKRPF